MFCAKCGAENPEGMNFCEKCGAALDVKVVGTRAKLDDTEKKRIRNIAICVAAVIVCVVAVVIFIAAQKNAQYNEKIDTATLYFEDLEYAKAEAAYLEAIEIKPKKDTAYIQLSELYIEDNEYEAALNILEMGKKEAGGKEIETRWQDLQNGAQYQAYLELCRDYQNKHGEGRFSSYGFDEYGEIVGLSVARLMDFNDDGNDELLLAYGQEGPGSVSPQGIVYEVWAWQNDELVKVFDTTEINYGTDVSGWISIECIDDVPHIWINKLSDYEEEKLLYYDGKNFVARYEAMINFWDTPGLTSTCYIEGQEVSQSTYENEIESLDIKRVGYGEAPYNKNGEIKIDFRSIETYYADMVISETEDVIKFLEDKGI